MKGKNLSQSLDSSSVNKTTRQTPNYMSFTKAFSLTRTELTLLSQFNCSFNDLLIGFDPSMQRELFEMLL